MANLLKCSLISTRFMRWIEKWTAIEELESNGKLFERSKGQFLNIFIEFSFEGSDLPIALNSSSSAASSFQALSNVGKINNESKIAKTGPFIMFLWQKRHPGTKWFLSLANVKPGPQPVMWKKVNKSLS